MTSLIIPPLGSIDQIIVDVGIAPENLKRMRSEISRTVEWLVVLINSLETMSAGHDLYDNKRQFLEQFLASYSRHIPGLTEPASRTTTINTIAFEMALASSLLGRLLGPVPARQGCVLRHSDREQLDTILIGLYDSLRPIAARVQREAASLALAKGATPPLELDLPLGGLLD